VSWRWVQITIASVMVLGPTGIMVRGLLTSGHSDEPWLARATAAAVGAMCVVQYAAILAIIEMPWGSN